MVGHLDDDRLRWKRSTAFPTGRCRCWTACTGTCCACGARSSRAGSGRQGLRASLASVGLDTWGVDFGLLAADDTLLGNPYHYRDSRTDGMMEEAFEIVPRAEIFEQTGIQFMQINSLYQLLAMATAESPALHAARTFLNMPDLFNFLAQRAQGQRVLHRHHQPVLRSPRRDWARDAAGAGWAFPARSLARSCRRAPCWGTLRALRGARRPAARRSRSIAPAGHDTASAVAAVPATSEDYVYLSSGTWSLMGVEVREAGHHRAEPGDNFTNEGGVGEHLPPAQEHHGPVAGARVPPRVGAGRRVASATTS